MELICVCGHGLKEHGISPHLDQACYVYAVDGGKYEDNCMEFKLDNLRFLEQKYEQSKLSL
jgi:hypothetical protein